MPQGLIESAIESFTMRQRRFYGVAVAQVVSNLDLTGLARVQVKLPWLPGYEPWARVAVPLAGSDRGTFVIPQTGDEVLVAFNHGDVREPFVVGSLWNGQDRPPAPAPIDASNKFLIRTPLGHEVELDDLQQSVKVTTLTDQSITLDPQKVELSTAQGTATVTLDTAGNVTVEGKVSISLKAPKIAIEGGTVDVTAKTAATVKGGATCKLEAPLVKIN